MESLRRVMTRLQRMMAAAPRGELAAADLLVLHHIAHGPPLTPGAIAHVTGLTTGSVTKLIDRLESMGLVERLPNPVDRRSSLLAVPPSAHAKIGAKMHGFHTQVAKMFMGWTRADLRQFASFLARLDGED